MGKIYEKEIKKIKGFKIVEILKHKNFIKDALGCPFFMGPRDLVAKRGSRFPRCSGSVPLLSKELRNPSQRLGLPSRGAV